MSDELDDNVIAVLMRRRRNWIMPAGLRGMAEVIGEETAAMPIQDDLLDAMTLEGLMTRSSDRLSCHSK